MNRAPQTMPIPVPRATRPKPGRRGTGAAAALAAILTLTACGGGADSTSSGGGAAAPAERAAGDGASAASAEQSDGGAATGADAGPDKAAASGVLVSAAQAGQRRIRVAEITLQVSALAPAAARVRQVAESAGGYVSSETTGLSQSVTGTSTGDDKTRTVEAGEGVVVLRVPEPDLDAAIAKVAAIGTELSRSQSDQDVTGEIADVASRIETQKQSVARTRQLLAKAASVQDIVFIEGELTKREAELEALQARLKSLSDRADFATLTTVLQVPGTPAADDEPTTGFLAGLREGWAALVASTNVVLTVLGALLPVAVVLTVVGYPASVLLRRRSRRQAAEREAAAARWAAQQVQPAAPPARVPAMAGPAPAGPASPAAPGTGTGGTGPTG